MTTPSYSELVAAVRREGEAILASGQQDLDIAVPTCGDWRMRDLLVHVGRVYSRAAKAVAERATTALDLPPDPGPDVDACDFLREHLDELVDTLGSANADTPVWNAWPVADEAAFWARRMAHESAVHRYDAQRAHGLAQPIDADLASDGMDELVDLVLERVVHRDAPSLPTGTFHFIATDGSEWVVRCEDDKVERLPAARNVDVTITGPASSLLLAAYGRVKWASLETSGDESLLAEWSRAFRF